MKRSVLLSAIIFGSLFYNSAKAQVSIHFGFNIPARPVYAPAPPPQPVDVYDDDDFDDSDDYYYLPEVEAYYSVPRHCYYYMNSGQWVSAAYLPGAYRNYDWRSFRHYEIRASRPYFNHDVYRNRWGGDFNRGRDWTRRGNVYAGGSYGGNNRWNGGYNRPDNNGGWNKGNRDRDNNWGGGRPDNGNWNRPDRNNNGGWGRGQQPNNDNRGNNGGWGQPRNNGGGWGGGQQQQDRGNGGGWGGRGRDNDGGNRGDRGGRGFAGQFAQTNGGINARQPRF
ncbi:hypothetical protein INP83_16105 [Mucilaginibacter sp. 21P]|uniref:hypothetical protein n=1 Tax=Mucilaginibacter sp. 21P TaxID=2778902 RepID=UPI001C56588D|nr:hypothetical protein [Mucilaginibacter sp. 21P]QXV64602.1 hypothetical protein INP83_16105 [Mucilaginibacter sp. 21P]